MSMLKRKLQAAQQERQETVNDVTTDLMEKMLDLDQKHRQRATSTSTAIQINPEGDAVLGKFVVSNVGLVLPENTTEDEWMALLSAVNKVKTAVQWIVADWAAFGADRQWGSKYDDIAAQTGYTVESLTDMVYVAKNVQFSVRTEKLSFTHHKLVAAYPIDEQRELLQTAVENKWNVKLFRRYLQTGSPQEEKRTNVSNPFDFRAKKRDFSQFLRTANKAMLGSDVARRTALGWISEQRRWLDEIEKMFNQESELS